MIELMDGNYASLPFGNSHIVTVGCVNRRIVLGAIPIPIHYRTPLVMWNVEKFAPEKLRFFNLKTQQMQEPPCFVDASAIVFLNKILVLASFSLDESKKVRYYNEVRLYSFAMVRNMDGSGDYDVYWDRVQLNGLKVEQDRKYLLSASPNLYFSNPDTITKACLYIAFMNNNTEMMVRTCTIEYTQCLGRLQVALNSTSHTISFGKHILRLSMLVPCGHNLLLFGTGDEAALQQSSILDLGAVPICYKWAPFCCTLSVYNGGVSLESGTGILHIPINALRIVPTLDDQVFLFHGLYSCFNAYQI